MIKILFFLFCVSVVTFTKAASINGFEAKYYGFVRASATYASEALASYNNINLSAPTHAPAQTRSEDKRSRVSFQGQQSRVGFTLEKSNDISSRLEFDFIDFNKSSPTTQMNPRVRIASITYHNGNSMMIFGQDWDLFSPVTSFTFDYVGLYFMAGNTGFMRQQFQYLYSLGEWELGGAIGMAGNNPGNTDADLETSKSPSYSGRIVRKINHGRFGVSGIYAGLSYHSTGGPSREAYGLNVFYEQMLGRLSLKSEFYTGKNLANIGSLAIGKGTASSDVKEFGGTLTAQFKLLERDYLFGGTGLAKIDNPSELTPFSLSATNVIVNPGISENLVSRFGWEHKVTDDFSWITEMSRYQTVSKINNDEYQQNIVYGLESGVQLRF